MKSQLRLFQGAILIFIVSFSNPLFAGEKNPYIQAYWMSLTPQQRAALAITATGAAVLTSPLWLLSGCSKNPVRPEDFAQLGIFSKKYDGETASQLRRCDGGDAPDLVIEVSRPDESKNLNLKVLGTLDNIQIGPNTNPPTKYKLALFTRGGDAEMKTFLDPCDGGDGGDVRFIIPDGESGLTYAQLTSWVISNPKYKTAQQTYNNGLPNLYLISTGGFGSDAQHNDKGNLIVRAGNRGRQGDIYVGAQLIKPEVVYSRSLGSVSTQAGVKSVRQINDGSLASAVQRGEVQTIQVKKETTWLEDPKGIWDEYAKEFQR